MFIYYRHYLLWKTSKTVLRSFETERASPWLADAFCLSILSYPSPEAPTLASVAPKINTSRGGTCGGSFVEIKKKSGKSLISSGNRNLISNDLNKNQTHG